MSNANLDGKKLNALSEEDLHGITGGAHLPPELATRFEHARDAAIEGRRLARLSGNEKEIKEADERAALFLDLQDAISKLTGK